MTELSRVIIISLSIVVVFILGFTLNRLGRPYNQILFNVHKIVALGVVIIGFISVRRYLIQTNPGLIIIVSLCIVGLCIIALFASGAMLSIGKIDQSILIKLHFVSSILMVGSTIIFLIELTRRIKA